MNKKILMDEQNRPVAVQIDYADWLVVEDMVEEALQKRPEPEDLSEFCGIFKQTIDPVEYQRKIRDEWS